MRYWKIQKTSGKLFPQKIVVILYHLFAVLLLLTCFFILCQNIRADNLTSQKNTANSNSIRTSVSAASSSSAKSSGVDEAHDTPMISAADTPLNPYNDLCIPTWITKVDDTYFLVDCYHDQILFNDNLTDPLNEWLVMTDDIRKGHTLASDGIVYLADDTERSRILVFEKDNDSFIHTQTFHEIGNRPHYIIYNESTDTFYVWSSLSGEMYLFRHSPHNSHVYLSQVRRIEALNNVYVRSFTIIDDEIYFVSCNSSIVRADLKNFEILEIYPVPDNMAGMIQLTKIQDYFYITISTDIAGNQDYATILRTKDLTALADGDYEDIYDQFIGGGTPYYITWFDNAYYLTEHRLPGHSVWRFQVEDNMIQNVETIY